MDIDRNLSYVPHCEPMEIESGGSMSTTGHPPASETNTGLGEKWMECPCGRWMHDKCIDQVVSHAVDKERFCSFCVGTLIILWMFAYIMDV